MENNKIIGHYSIEIEDNAFDKESVKNFSHTVRKYDKNIQKANLLIDDLDRFDSFGDLIIKGSQYMQSAESGEYGIPKKDQPAGSALYDHQVTATKEFLRDLRGFGILADVVGSGKTYEAMSVVSELAIRNKIRSMLYIVPEQVLVEWVRVIEKCFGLGEGVLYHAGETLNESEMHIQSINGFYVPKRPIIVSMEDFSKWDEEVAKYLFDVIVVDEAHHLCDEEGEYAKAMKKLSLMVQTKIQAKSTYCLLLSATPHSGNLENMFRLWYFIRCTGGSPADFDEKSDKERTKDYLEEKNYYKQTVCRGATTVMEFIQIAKKIEVEQNYYNDFLHYLLTEKSTTEEQFRKMPSGKQNDYVTEFINADGNEEICEQVLDSVAKSYHNRVLRSIMIRQPNRGITKKKFIKNIYFFPTKKQIPSQVTFDDFGKQVTVSIPNMYQGKALDTPIGKVSFDEYIDYVRESTSVEKNDKFTDLLIRTLRLVDNIDAENNPYFKKKGSLQYYQDQFYEGKNDITNQVYPVTYNGTPEEIFEFKFQKVLEILKNHPDEKITIFFDYDLKRDHTATLFTNRLKETEFGSRIIIGKKENLKSIEKEFAESKDKILVAQDAAFSEGINLQTGNILINFQITPDPLAMDQRVGRVFRIGQKNNVTIYNLAAMNLLEGYVLAYFSKIGLMNSSTGDATIIAGANSEKKVTVRCNSCGRVKLLSNSDFAYYKEFEPNSLLCDSPFCKTRGEHYKEISVFEYKCDKCNKVFERDGDKYVCISSNNDGQKDYMCNQGGQGDREFYCRKICVMAHCRFFQRPEMQDCEALKAYRENKNIEDSELMQCCAGCRNSACPQKCHVGIGPEAIKACAEGKCDSSYCRPKPHSLQFNDEWVAKCPKCAVEGIKGFLKPVVAKTFATYVQGLYDFNQDNGESFTGELLKECRKVREIKNILENDEKFGER